MIATCSLPVPGGSIPASKADLVAKDINAVVGFRLTARRIEEPVSSLIPGSVPLVRIILTLSMFCVSQQRAVVSKLVLFVQINEDPKVRCCDSSLLSGMSSVGHIKWLAIRDLEARCAVMDHLQVTATRSYGSRISNQCH